MAGGRSLAADTPAWYAGTRARVEVRAGPGEVIPADNVVGPRQLCTLPGGDESGMNRPDARTTGFGSWGARMFEG